MPGTGHHRVRLDGRPVGQAMLDQAMRARLGLLVSITRNRGSRDTSGVRRLGALLVRLVTVASVGLVALMGVGTLAPAVASVAVTTCPGFCYSDCNCSTDRGRRSA